MAKDKRPPRPGNAWIWSEGKDDWVRPPAPGDGMHMWDDNKGWIPRPPKPGNAWIWGTIEQDWVKPSKPGYNSNLGNYTWDDNAGWVWQPKQAPPPTTVVTPTPPITTTPTPTGPTTPTPTTPTPSPRPAPSPAPRPAPTPTPISRPPVPTPIFRPPPAPAPTPRPPAVPPNPWITTPGYTTPPGIKQATPDLIIFDESSIEIGLLIEPFFQEFGGTELINISREDLINGDQVTYSPIINLSQLRQAFNSNNIINIAASQENQTQYGIDLILRGPLVPYLNENGDMVVEIDEIRENESIEVQITTSGTINVIDL